MIIIKDFFSYFSNFTDNGRYYHKCESPRRTSCARIIQFMESSWKKILLIFSKRRK